MWGLPWSKPCCLYLFCGPQIWKNVTRVLVSLLAKTKNEIVPMYRLLGINPESMLNRIRCKESRFEYGAASPHSPNAKSAAGSTPHLDAQFSMSLCNPRRSVITKSASRAGATMYARISKGSKKLMIPLTLHPL